jgi:predicted Zn-dependent protease with MMP-like domain
MTLHAPSLADFEIMADDALALIPGELRALAADVVIRVEDFPDEETQRDMELESPFDLLGLYCGVALTDKSVSDPGGMPDMVFLYRRPILDYWVETGEDLIHLIRHVLIHEIGHHFGFSDADMDALEQAADAADGD